MTLLKTHEEVGRDGILERVWGVYLIYVGVKPVPLK